jgi:hypothetical protein
VVFLKRARWSGRGRERIGGKTEKSMELRVSCEEKWGRENEVQEVKLSSQ